MNKPCKIAIYMRVSKEDNKDSESNSITNQRNLINEYINSCKEILVETIDEYFDDGVSGANFDRPKFNEMIENLKNKKHDCLIIKDFSRFGRNYIESSDYIEQIFPFLGIRFISVNDNYDSFKDKYNIRMDVSFKNLIHDLYIKDLSQKMRSAINTKIINGKYIPSMVMYGYKIVNDNTRKIVIDEYSSLIVRRIFNMISDGYTALEVAKTLNYEKVSTPNVYRKQDNKFVSTKENFWHTSTILKIVRDEYYTGKAIFNKKERIEIAKTKTVKLPKDQWIELENNHPAIITKELFDKAIYKLKNPDLNQDNLKKQRVLYAKVRCYCCDYTMKRTKSKTPKFFCETPKFIESPNCVDSMIEEEKIQKVIITAIQMKLKIAIEQNQIKDILKQKFKNNKLDAIEQLTKLETSINKISDFKFKAYEKYRDNQITKEDFNIKKTEYDKQIESLNEQVNQCKLLIDDETKSKEQFKSPLTDFITKNKPITELTRELVDSLIEKIVIHDVDKYEIVWKFEDMFI